MQIISSILHSKSAISRLPSSAQDLALQAYASSISIVWVATGSIMIITVVCGCFIQEKEVGGPGAKEGKQATGSGDPERLLQDPE